MASFRPGNTLVLAGHGFDEEGPYLKINDMTQREQVRFYVRGKTFTLKRLPTRRCVGRFDLATGVSSVCPLDVELLPDSKDDMCPACQEVTGFNPSFYYAASISPQQRAYNATPHYVYVAYFAPGFVKAGISSEMRGLNRLLEQGARAARIVGRFGNADDARQLEAALCSQEGMFETMRASKKLELLAEAPFDFEAAKRAINAGVASLDLARFGLLSSDGVVRGEARAKASADDRTPLDDALEREAVVEAGGVFFDLTTRYFGDAPAPSCNDLVVADASDDACAGFCCGMVGSTLVFEQGSLSHLVSLKEWESHVVELVEGEILHEYDAAPQQFSLF